MSSYQYRNSHYKDKMVSWQLYFLLINVNLHILKDSLYIAVRPWWTYLDVLCCGVIQNGSKITDDIMKQNFANENCSVWTISSLKSISWGGGGNWWKVITSLDNGLVLKGGKDLSKAMLTLFSKTYMKPWGEELIVLVLDNRKIE